MVERQAIIALRMARQHLTRKAGMAEYTDLYRDLQPGQNVYWNGFGDPPSLTYRADFDDIAFNRRRQAERALVKGRFAGGNLGWIMAEDLEMFACLYQRPLDERAEKARALLALMAREGPLNIHQMKESTGMLAKEITPALHRLQAAFLVYEDQYDGEWDRWWYLFPEMFPAVNLARYTRAEALKILLRRFAHRLVVFDADMAKSFYKLPAKEIKAAIAALTAEGVLTQAGDGHLLTADADALCAHAGQAPQFVYAMHRNDFLVKAGEHQLKGKYPHAHADTLYYLLIDGAFRGAAVGKFRYTPEVEDVILDLPREAALARKEEILAAVRALCGANNRIRRYLGEALP